MLQATRPGFGGFGDPFPRQGPLGQPWYVQCGPHSVTGPVQVKPIRGANGDRLCTDPKMGHLFREDPHSSFSSARVQDVAKPIAISGRDTARVSWIGNITSSVPKGTTLDLCVPTVVASGNSPQLCCRMF